MSLYTILEQLSRVNDGRGTIREFNGSQREGLNSIEELEYRLLFKRLTIY